LYVPQQFLLAHALIELHGIWQHYQLMAQELLYLVSLAFGSSKGAAVLCAATGLLSAAAAFLLAARLAGPTTGLLAAAIFYATPW
jgi:hypothetical protein